MSITGGDTNGVVMADLVANLQRKEAGLRIRGFIETVTFSTQAAGTIGVGIIPKGAIPLGVWHNTSASLVATTLSLGITGAAAKYRAAATSTVINAWIKDELNAAVGLPTTAQEEILATNNAALPAAGTLRVLTLYLEV